MASAFAGSLPADIGRHRSNVRYCVPEINPDQRSEGFVICESGLIQLIESLCGLAITDRDFTSSHPNEATSPLCGRSRSLRIDARDRPRRYSL
jgi:hypothetical protein